jgi:hypothetical protein
LLLAVGCAVGCRWEYEDLSGSLGDESAPDGSLGGEDGSNPLSSTGAVSSGGSLASGGAGSMGASASMGGESSSSGGVSEALPTGGTGGDSSLCDPCGAGESCFLGSCLPVRRVFLTSTIFPANFGSALDAAAECQALAEGQGLGGTWLAWISDSVTSPASSFSTGVGPYILLDDTVVAEDFADLTDGVLSHSIDRDETGALIMQRETWTGTDFAGNSTGEDCNNWKSVVPAHLATQGVSDQSSAGWSDIYFQFCDRMASLYCFEQ